MYFKGDSVPVSVLDYIRNPKPTPIWEYLDGIPKDAPNHDQFAEEKSPTAFLPFMFLLKELNVDYK